MTNITHVQWHIGDFLGGVMQMDGAEIGAYTMLIMAHYQAGTRGVPSDDRKLMQITHTNPKVWKRVKDTVLEKFKLVEGFYIHDRVVDELQKIHAKAGPGRPSKVDVGSPKSFDDETTSEPQVENKLLELKETEKTNLKPITYNQKPNKKENKQHQKNEFEEFWKLCPRKVGKGKAEEKYWIARKEVEAEFIRTAMIAHAKENKDTEIGFIPHPATWLHGKRYFDETKTVIVEQEKRQWPGWKGEIATILGDHMVKGWFNTAVRRGSVLTFSSKFEYDRIKQFHEADLRKVGIFELRLDPTQTNQKTA